MKTLHIAPGDSAGGSLKQAITDAGRDDQVLRWIDDLSCGPIDPDDPSIREEWWTNFQSDRDIEGRMRAFWIRVAETTDRLVVWVGRHSAQELSFFLFWASRMAARPYEIIDVTGLCLPFTKRDGSTGITPPISAVSMVPSEVLRSLLDNHRPVTAEERLECAGQWERLKNENAPFRVVTANRLVSVPVDYFDQLLISEATIVWQKIARLIGFTMGNNSEPYWQVSDLMLLTRVVSLVKEGKLVADGDPWDMRACCVRLP
jgi:hypothetical protein